VGENSFGEPAAQRLGARRGARVTAESPSVDTDALAADLEALAHAHPEIAGKLHLAATTLVEQKAEIKLLSEQITVVKGALSHFLEGLGTRDGAEGLVKEAAVLQVLLGIAATLLDDLHDDDLEDDEREDDEREDNERAVAGVVMGDVNDVDMMTPPAPAAAPAPPGAPVLVRGAAIAALSTAAPRRRSAKHPHVQGAAVLESLVEASRLQSQGKMAAAAAVRAAIPAGTEPKEHSINKAAQALESMLFQFGGLSTVTRVLEKLMSRAPVAALLPDHLKATDEVVKTQAAMVEAVRDFLRVLTPHRGRRTDMNANAFWWVVAAVLPQDLLKDRQGRSCMRMLHVNYRVVKKGVAHGRATEAQGGWQLAVTC
jgi:hypothetical protein